jgi:hypothetical protein
MKLRAHANNVTRFSPPIHLQWCNKSTFIYYSRTSSRAMQLQGGKICPCDCTAQILPRGQQLIKILCHQVHNATLKMHLQHTQPYGPSPSSNLVCSPPPPSRAPSPNIYPKARGTCVVKGGLGGRCRPCVTSHC